MSIVDINQFIGLPVPDKSPAESGGENAPRDCDLFNDYLQKAHSCSSNNRDDWGANGGEKNSGDPAAPAGQSFSAAAPAPPQIASASRTDSEGDLNAAQPITEQSKHEQMLLEQSPISAKDENKEANKKKDEKAGKSGNQSDMQINPQAAGANSNQSQLENKISSAQAKVKIADDFGHTAGKIEKTITEANASADAELTKEIACQAADAKAKTSSVVPPTGGKAEEKNITSNFKRKDMSSGEKSDVEIILTAGENKTANAKACTETSAPLSDARQGSLHQNEKKQAAAVHASEAASLPDVSRQTQSLPQTINVARLQAAENERAIPVRAEKVDAGIQKTKTATDNTADTPAGILQRSESAAKAAAVAAQHGAEPTGSQMDRVRFVERVQRAFAAIGDRGGSVHLKLSPPELGTVHVEISVSKGVMKARLGAETRETKDLLLENLPALRDRLAQQNIKIQQFDVDLRDPSSGGLPQQTANQADTGSPGRGHRDPRPRSQDKTSTTAPVLETKSPADHSGLLNVIV